MVYDLVFEGGGAKGMVFVGALQEFEARGHKYGRLLGTSAGAITATMLAADYSSDEMLAALNEKLLDGTSVFTSFMAPPGPFDQAAVNKSSIRAFLRAIKIPMVPNFLEDRLDDAITEELAQGKNFRHVFSFIEEGGWYSADNFIIWLERKLNSGTFSGKPRNFGAMTMQQFFDATQTELSLVASDTTGKQMLILNHISAPDCPVVWAARMSMSIPLLWQEVIWQPNWGAYMGHDIHGNSIVDGGLLSNFPIELFLSDLKDVTCIMGDKTSQNVLGFLIDDDLAVPNAPEIPVVNEFINISDLATVQRLSRLLDTTLSARDKMVIDSYSNMVVRMPAKGFGTTEFGMSAQRRDSLVEAGSQAMKNYFSAIEHSTQPNISFGMDTEEAVRDAVIDRIATKILR
jgi:predicted acylesterase/phospholipase RssA